MKACSRAFNSKSNDNNGFTLIEVLVVAAIISIFASIAIPSYQDFVLKARRAEGISFLFQIMELQERYFTENLSYATDLTELGYVSSTDLESESSYYEVSAAACDGTVISDCVLLTANAINEQQNDDDLSLSSLGSKLPDGFW